MSRPFSPQRVVILTGAGISAESGIATFRDSRGLWEKHRIEDVATPEAFENDPELVHRFYSLRRAQMQSVQSNPAHDALARFERTFPGTVTLITQNVDDLHERAGSENVLHMHGQLLQMRCSSTGQAQKWTCESSPRSVCNCCGLPGRLRPNVVWFGEVPFFLDEITSALSRCNLFVSIGTSGNVYPAAGFFQIARASGAHTVELNLEPSANAEAFDEGHYGPASKVVVDFFSRLLDEQRPESEP